MNGKGWGLAVGGLAVAAAGAAGAVAVRRRVADYVPVAPTGAAPFTEPSEPYAGRAAEHLSALVRIPTVSSRVPAEVDTAAFDRLHAALAELYPRVHAGLDVQPIPQQALLLHWRGVSDERPVVLMAHQDVVPVVPEEWSGDPFSGQVRDGCVWGRGTLDDKGALVVLLEAVESLLAEGFRPAQDVWLLLGDDEEIAGTSAEAAVVRLRELGVRPWLVLDEGGAVVTGAFPGVEAPVAVVGVTEKGILDVEISAEATGGHASTPERRGATWRIARAITEIEDHPFPPSLSGPALAMVDVLGRSSPRLRPLLAYAEPLAPALARAFTRISPETNAMVRTTVVATMLQGSPGANVVATSARANLNIRIAPGESVSSVVARLARIIDDDEVDLRIVASSEPSPVSPTDGPQFAVLSAAVTAAYPETLVTPYVMLGASDARHLTAIAEHVYRFSPFAMTREQRETLHGTDEHVTVDALGRGVVFYRALLRGLAAPR